MHAAAADRPDGRSRGFVNGQPATLQDLKAVGALLVDIHGQHAHQSLLEAPAQRALLDAYGGLDALARDVAEAYGEWQSAAAELANGAPRGTRPRAAELELRAVSGWPSSKRWRLVPGEVEALGPERDRLANTDKLIGGVSTALERLTEDEAALLTRPSCKRDKRWSGSHSTMPRSASSASNSRRSRFCSAMSNRRSRATAIESRRIRGGSKRSRSGLPRFARCRVVTEYR